MPVPIGDDGVNAGNAGPLGTIGIFGICNSGGMNGPIIPGGVKSPKDKLGNWMLRVLTVLAVLAVLACAFSVLLTMPPP